MPLSPKEKPIWEDIDSDCELAEEPIDTGKNQHTQLLNVLRSVINIKDKIHLISDLAFDEVDKDGSNSLDNIELADVMREVAISMKCMPPSE